MSDPDPSTVVCPACYAGRGEPCTKPTNRTRTPVSWFHVSREEAARRAQTNTH